MTGPPFWRRRRAAGHSSTSTPPWRSSMATRVRGVRQLILDVEAGQTRGCYSREAGVSWPSMQNPERNSSWRRQPRSTIVTDSTSPLGSSTTWIYLQPTWYMPNSLCRSLVTATTKRSPMLWRRSSPEAHSLGNSSARTTIGPTMLGLPGSIGSGWIERSLISPNSTWTNGTIVARMANTGPPNAGTSSTYAPVAEELFHTSMLMRSDPTVTSPGKTSVTCERMSSIASSDFSRMCVRMRWPTPASCAIAAA